MINAIVLAAGQSQRMGTCKALLSFGQTTFLQQIVSVLNDSKADRITVVLGAQADKITGRIELPEADIVVNDQYLQGQLSSLIAAIESLPQQAEAIVVCLVDNPFIKAETVDSLIDAYRLSDAPIALPAFAGRRGHPALFSKALFAELLDAPLDKGARHVVRANAAKIVEIDAPDDSIAISIDTPADYRARFGVDPRLSDGF